MAKNNIVTLLLLFISLHAFAQEGKNLDDYKKLGRDSIISRARHELLFRHGKIGLNLHCYSRVEVLAGIEDGKEALYVNFDNPIRFREIVNPDRIGINMLGGESYYSSRADIEKFFYKENESLVSDFLSCFAKSQAGSNPVVLPGPKSPSSSYVEVIDYGDNYSFTLVSAVSEIRYRLKKADCSLKEMERKIADNPENQKPFLEEIK